MRGLLLLRGALALGLTLESAYVAGADELPSPEKLALRLGAGGDVAGRREAAYQLGKLGPAAKAAVPALMKALEDPDKQVWSFAIGAIAAIGPEAKDAIPILLTGLDSRTVRGNRERDRRQTLFRSAYALSKIGVGAIPQLQEALKGADVWQRAGAAKALGGIGPAARGCAPLLAENLRHDDPDERRETIDALGAIGADAVPALQTALDSKEASARAGAALALAQIGASAKPTAGRLAELARVEKDAKVRAAVLSSLARVGLDPAEAVTLLVQAIKDDDEQIRHAAINSLYLLRSASQLLIPALTRLLHESNPAISERAALVLGRLGANASAAVPAILEVARQRRPASPVFFRAIAEIGPTAVPEVLRTIQGEAPDTLGRHHWSVTCLATIGGQAVAPLTHALTSTSVAVRLVAARALGELGPVAAPAIKELLAAASDTDPRVRATALAAVVSSRAMTVAAAARVEAALKDESAVVRAAAAELAPYLGEHAHSLTPALLATLSDNDAQVRQAVVKALGSAGPDAEPALPRLIEVLPSSAPSTQLAILNVFAGIGPRAAAALPPIRERLHVRDDATRAAATLALARIAPATEALPVLLPALDDGALPVRKIAALQLAELGEKAASAAPRLTELLQRDEERDYAFEALKKVGSRSIPSLITMLTDRDLTVKIFACQRLGKLGPAAIEAAPGLEAIAGRDHEREDLRKNAREALKKIKL